MATLLTYGLGIFLALHGIVHGWYVVISRGWLEGEDADFGWNGTSWLLSGVFARDTVLDAASVGYGLVVVGFVAGGAGFVLGAALAGPLLVGAATLSTLVIVLMWDGRAAQLTEKGALGVLINLGVLAWQLGFV